MRETQILRGLHKARANCFADGFVSSPESQEQLARGNQSLRRIGAGQQTAKDIPFAVADLLVGAARQPLSAMYNGLRGQQAPAQAPDPASIAPTLITPAIDKLQDRHNMLQNLSRGTAFLEGPGSGTSDSIPANLSRGEAVLPAKTVRAVGAHNIARLIQDTNDGKPPKGLRAGGSYSEGYAGPNVSDYDKPKYVPPKVDPATGDYVRGGTAPAATQAAEAAPKPAGLWNQTKAVAGDLYSSAKNIATGAPKPEKVPLLQRDVVDLAKGTAKGTAQGTSNLLRKGVTSGFIPGAASEAAWDSYSTGTDDFGRRTGLETGSLPEDLTARAAGTIQNVGNYITLGLADRVGNAMAGNGWGHSSSYGGGGFLGDTLDKLTGSTSNAPGAVARPQGQVAQPAGAQPAGAQPAGAQPAEKPFVGPHPDLTAALGTQSNGKLPQDLSKIPGLQAGQIYRTVDPKTGTPTYSGIDVKAGAKFTDGLGKSITPRGSVDSGDVVAGTANNVVSGNAGLRAAQGGPDVSQALQAAAARGDWDAVQQHYQRNGGTWLGETAAQEAEKSSPRALLLQQIQRGLAGGGRLTRAGMAALQNMEATDAQRDASQATLRSAQYRHDTPSGDAVLQERGRLAGAQALAANKAAADARDEMSKGNEALHKRLALDPAAQGATPEEAKQRHAELVDHLSRTNRTVKVNGRDVDLATAYRVDPRAAEQAVAEESGTLSLSKLAKANGENFWFKNVPKAGEIELAEPMGDVNMADYKHGMGVGPMIWEKAFGSGVVRIKGANNKVVSIPLSKITEDTNSASIFQALAAANKRFADSQKK